MDRRELLELVELLDIPETREIMISKITEMRIIYGQTIAEYRCLKKQFKNQESEKCIRFSFVINDYEAEVFSLTGQPMERSIYMPAELFRFIDFNARFGETREFKRVAVGSRLYNIKIACYVKKLITGYVELIDFADDEQIQPGDSVELLDLYSRSGFTYHDMCELDSSLDHNLGLRAEIVEFFKLKIAPFQ